MKGIGFALLVVVLVAVVAADNSLVQTPYGAIQGVVTETARAFMVCLELVRVEEE